MSETMKISTFEFELERPIPPTQEKDVVIENYMPPVVEHNKPKGRAYIPKDREVYGPYLEQVFYQNEIDRYYDKQKTDAQIQYEFLNKYPHYELKRRFKQKKQTINYLRTLYNRRQLYAAQEQVNILSFRYNEEGIITVDGRSWFRYLQFIQAYKRCLEYKIADPRFIEPEKIIALRNRINSGDVNWEGWTIPSAKWIKEFETAIGKPAFDSVYFPAGWKREDAPSAEEFD